MKDLLRGFELLLQELDVKLVRSHLTTKGWVLDDDASSRNAIVYVNADFPGVDAIVPASKNLADFLPRMAELIILLAKLELRSPGSILQDFLLPDGDKFQFGNGSRITRYGSIPLDTGIKLVSGIRKSVRAAAFSTIKPGPFFGNERNQQADDLLKRCRLGQTEVGSYIMSVVIPTVWTQVPSMYEFFDEATPVSLVQQIAREPFGRQVAINLMRAISHIEEATKQKSFNYLLDKVEEGISANLCDSILGMQPVGYDFRFTIGVQWSKGPPRMIQLPKVVTLKNADFDILQKAASQLRGNTVVIDNERIEGFITNLHEDYKLLKGIRGLITLQLAGGEVVKVQLAPTDYAAACDAHRDTRVVAIIGEISRHLATGNITVRNYLRFEVLGRL